MSMRRARRWGYFLTGAVAVAGVTYLAWGTLRRWLEKRELGWSPLAERTGLGSSDASQRDVSSLARYGGDLHLASRAEPDVPSSVTSAFQVFRQQYETNKRTMTATILSLCGLLQNRLERFFDTDGIIRKLRSESTAITSRDAASSSCTEERAIQTLWKQLTVLSLTRVLASAYVYCLLQALVCIQVNLLGRYLSLATALARSERYGRRPDSSSPLPTEAALLTELLALPGASQAQPLRQVQRAYLRVARKLGEVNFLETLVTRKLMRAMRSELDERDWDLQTPLRVSDLASLWHGACCRLEKCQDIQAVAVDTTQRVDDIETKQLSPSAEEHSATPVHEGEHRKGLWMASILQQLVQESRQSLVVELLRSEQISKETGSPRFETHAELASRASVTDTSLQQATLQLNALLDETLDVMDSLDFVEFVESIFDAVWRQILQELTQTVAMHGADSSLALLRWLPKCASTSRQVFADEHYLRVTRESPSFERFAALVFLSGEKEGPTDNANHA